MVEKVEKKDEEDEKEDKEGKLEEKERGSNLKNGLKIAAGIGVLAGVTWAVQKTYRRYHRKKFIKILLELISEETKKVEERIQELTKYSLWSREAEWIFQEFKTVRKAFKKLKDQDQFNKAFNRWLTQYGHIRRVPVDQLAKILHWNLEKMTDFGQ